MFGPGSSHLLAYQATIYESLGYTPFMAGILGSVWCVLNGTGNFLGGVIGDYVGRKRQIGKLDTTMVILVRLICSSNWPRYASGPIGPALRHNEAVRRHRQQSWKDCCRSIHLPHDCSVSRLSSNHFRLMLILRNRYATGVDCPSLVYSSELYPGEWRALGVATSLSAVLWGCLIFTAAAPAALANIGALYYVVFIVLTFFQLLLVIFFFPDVSGLVN